MILTSGLMRFGEQIRKPLKNYTTTWTKELAVLSVWIISGIHSVFCRTFCLNGIVRVNMMKKITWLSRQKKLPIIGFGALLLFLIAGDIQLYYVLQNEHVFQLDPNGRLSKPLTLTPFYSTTVKSLMGPHECYHIGHPLSVLLIRIFNIPEDYPFITPNLISILNAFVGLFSARCVMSRSLTMRRIGVFLFIFRTFLDAFDGILARARKSIGIDDGNLGVFVDPACDGVGYVSVLLVCLFYPNHNSQNHTSLPHVRNGTKTTEKYSITSVLRSINSKNLLHLAVYSIQSLVSSSAWTYYVVTYQNSLEQIPSTTEEMLAIEQVKKSTMTLIVFWLWRVFNSQSTMLWLLIAVFFNRLPGFLNFMKYFGFIVYAFLIPLTIIHGHNVLTYLQSVKVM